MAIIVTLVIGLIVGAVAKIFVPGRDPGGIVVTMLVGIAGAFVATYAGHAMGIYQAGEFAGFLGAVLGAIVLLLALRAARR